MKIFESTQYVNLQEREQPWYKLEVISMWDSINDPICYRYADATLISYRLLKNTPTSKNSYKSETIIKLTSEMQRELINMGYQLK